MSGECKSYRLNEPMAWEEFKAMPDDLKVAYIKAIRAKYNAPASAIAQMMGVDRGNLSKYLKGLGFGKESSGPRKWEKMAFAEWCYGVSAKASEESPAVEEAQQPADIAEEEQPAEAEEEQEEEEVDAPVPAAEPVTPAPLMAVPESGTMDFTGDATRIMNTLVNLFGGAKVKLEVRWHVVEG